MYIKYAKTRDVKDPIRANAGDAIDVFIPNNFNATGKRILPSQNIVIPTGLKFEVPFGYALMFVNKSGVAAKKSLIIGACLIDHGYSGEVHLDIHNIGSETRYLTNGMKLGQLIQIPVMTPSLLCVLEEDLYKQVPLVSERGEGKMGSTNDK
ncbi:MAG: hypothetical protein QM489_00685 [Candidatus Izemoplasma sp.]